MHRLIRVGESDSAISRRQFIAAVGSSLPLAAAVGCSPPSLTAPAELEHSITEATYDLLQREAFTYFMEQYNPANGLIRDRTRVRQPAEEGSAPASIAAVAFALMSYPIGVERGFLEREDAVERTLATLRFFAASSQGAESESTGYKGFYYHFLDMTTGLRAGLCELSTVDTGFLIAGMLAAAAYFNHDSAEEHEIRGLAHAMYDRVDWQWATNGGATLTHGWTPEEGFLKYRWEGYDEALLLYVLGLGSTTYPLAADSYAAWTRTYDWKQIYGHELLYAGPLFIHQFSHMWIDFRGIQDAFMRDKGSDYFENSRRATLVQQEYAVHNPGEFVDYGEYFWGLTASDGPGWVRRQIRGVDRQFFSYYARGAPFGPDDGTVAPWAALASLPFAPDIVLATIRNFQLGYPEAMGKYCFKCSFNPTFTANEPGQPSWTSEYHYGVNLGPVVIMIENHRSGLPWQLMRQCPHVVAGLRKAGFSGGWL